MTIRFADRRAAGRELAERLTDWRGSGTVVLGLVRGGVPVAYEVARALAAPLDVFVVRKLGAPGQPELAMGAIAGGGALALNQQVVQALGLTDADMRAIARREMAALADRERRYRGDRPPLELAGRTVLLVDDGLATGSSMRAAVGAVRTMQPGRVVVAVPVAPEATVRSFEEVADAVVCVATPPYFLAVGEHYRDFTQVTDEEVARLLEAAGAPEG